jgi:ribosome-associated protein
VASGTNPVQVRALCDDVLKTLDERKTECLRTDGYPSGRWVVLDVADVIVHIFHQEERAFYNLERLWSNGTNTTVYAPEEK